MISAERTHCHRVSTNNADLTGSSCGSFATHYRADEYTVLPARSLIYERNGGRTTSAEDKRADRYAVAVLELGRDARTVDSGSGKSGVGMSRLNGLAVCVNGIGSPRSANPVDEMSGLLLIGSVFLKTFPPYFHSLGIESYVGEDGILSRGCESVVVGVRVGTGSHAEETVFGVDSVKSAVGSFLNPGDVVTYGEHSVTCLSVTLGRNKHCKVGLAASGRECCAHIDDFLVGLFDTQNEHMLCHPHFVLTLIRSDSQCKALLAEQYVAAVTAVDGDNSVVLRELADISLFRVDLALSVSTSYEVVAVAESFEYVVAYSGHNSHIQYDVNGIGKLDTNLGDRTAYGTHRERNYVHSTTLVSVFENALQFCVCLLRLPPVVGRTAVFFLTGANESSSFYTSNVVGVGAVEQATGKGLLIELNHFSSGKSFFGQSVVLLFFAGNPNYFVRITELNSAFNKFQYFLIRSICHSKTPFIEFQYFLSHILYQRFGVIANNILNF